MNPWICSGLILSLSFLVGCDDSSADAPGAPVVTQAQNGETVALARGATLTVELAGNPTTGYQWTVARIDADFLRDLGSTYEADSSAIGSGGTYAFRFEARKAGTTDLALVYRRAWGTSADDETYSLTVDIQDGGAAASVVSLEGTQWKLAAWSASSLAPADFNLTAAFADGQISGRSAVNLYSGSYSASANGAFSVGMITMTLMASDENSMRAESLYHQLLAQARRHRVDQGQLVLSDSGDQDLLIFDPQ